MFCCAGGDEQKASEIIAPEPKEEPKAPPPPKEEPKEPPKEEPKAPPAPPKEFKITLKKEGDAKLGVDISHTADKTKLKIKLVKQGLVSKWNKDNSDKPPIKDGDCIIECNGVKGNSEMILAKIKDQTLELTIETA